MSTRGKNLRHPVSGREVATWNGFSWPAFLLGVFWLLIKDLYAHFLINLILLIITVGFAAPFIWLVYGFIGNDAHRNSLLKRGYLTKEQWEERNAQAAAPAPAATEKDYIAQLRELADLRDKGILTEDEFSKEKAKLLDS